MMKEPEVKRWTAKRKAELIRQIYRGQTTVSEAARTQALGMKTPSLVYQLAA